MRILATIKQLKLLSKVLGWFNVPYTKIITPILEGVVTIGTAWLNYIITSNQKKTDEIIKKQEEITTTIETEVAKPLPQQNNDAIRDALRKKHGG